MLEFSGPDDQLMSGVTHLISASPGKGTASSLLFVAHSQFKSHLTDEGESRMEMLQKTPIRLYDANTAALLCTYLVPDLSVQSMSYFQPACTFLVLSSGQHKIYCMEPPSAPSTRPLCLEISTRFPDITDNCMVEGMELFEG